MDKVKIVHFLTYTFLILTLLLSCYVAIHLFQYFIHEIPFALEQHFGGH